MEAVDVTAFLEQLDKQIELQRVVALGAVATALTELNNLVDLTNKGYLTYRAGFNQLKAHVEQGQEPEEEPDRPGTYL